MKREWERSEVTELFIEAANLCKPDHSYLDNPYPIEMDEVKVTWKRRDSSFTASCGPRKYGYKAKFAVDLTHWNNTTPENGLKTIVHEVTHLEEGFHTQGSSHNPAFWEAMAKNVQIVIENIEIFNEYFGCKIDLEKFKEKVSNNPTSGMVDRRMETVDHRREEMERLIE